MSASANKYLEHKQDHKQMFTPHQEPEINSIAVLCQKQCLRNKSFIQRVARWSN